MRRSMVCGIVLAWGILGLLAEAVVARADESAAPGVEDNGALADSGSSARPTSADAAAPGPSGETWRYRRHQGQWWYWLPSEKWVVWNGDRWVAHVPQVSTRSSTRSSNARGGRYDYPPQQGNWGPVHYDRWGNRQYPYSRRKSGLQQLGPVPAMGGVRSLPGWGGER